MVKKNYVLIFTIITLVTVFLDQLVKYLVLLFKPNFNLSFLKIHLIKNTGAGFGILQGRTLILAIVSAIVALAVIFYYHKIPQEKFVQILFALFLGGVVGNLIDRVFRRYVVDFIDFSFWPAFNIADACISIAVVGLVVYFWKK